MKTLFALCLIIIVGVDELTGKEIEKKESKSKCEGILVHNKFHKKEILARGLNRPYQLAYDKSDHTIFFSYNTGTDEEDSFAIGYIKKNHTQHNVVEHVENGFAMAMDNKDNVIYYGGSGGVYKQHLNGNDTNVKNLVNYLNVWDMFFKEHLYFINFPSQHLYKLKMEESKGKIERQKHIHEKIFQFVIDGDDDIFFTNETGLYHIKNGTDHRVLYDAPKVYRAIEINNKGVPYFCAQNGVYVANKTVNALDKIAHIKNSFGLAFDNDDNIIYSDPHEIIKLVPGNENDC